MATNNTVTGKALAQEEAGGLLRTPTRAQNLGQFTFVVDAHTDVCDCIRGGVLLTLV